MLKINIEVTYEDTEGIEHTNRVEALSFESAQESLGKLERYLLQEDKHLIKQ